MRPEGSPSLHFCVFAVCGSDFFLFVPKNFIGSNHHHQREEGGVPSGGSAKLDVLGKPEGGVVGEDLWRNLPWFRRGNRGQIHS